jgi:NAD(P)-dependent dehydrogenase (short-subunit alcohol dehydrogenase family)
MNLGRVLITGGAGVVGSTIADHAVRAGAEEVVVFDVVFHQAAIPHHAVCVEPNGIDLRIAALRGLSSVPGDRES